MDIQAILNTTDSFSSEEEGFVNLPSLENDNHHLISHMHAKGKRLEDALERILREDSDDDSDDLNDRDRIDKILSELSPPRQVFDITPGGAEEDEARSVGNTTISTKPHTFSSRASPSAQNNRASEGDDDGRPAVSEFPDFDYGLCCAPATKFVNDMPRLQMENLHRNDEEYIDRQDTLRIRNDGYDERKWERDVYGGHNPEDWAVLQTILKEAGEEEEDGEVDVSRVVHVGNGYGEGQDDMSELFAAEKEDRPIFRGESSTVRSEQSADCNGMDVDAILRSINDDSSDGSDRDLIEFDNLIAKISSECRSKLPKSISKSNSMPISMSNSQSISESKPPVPLPPNRSNRPNTPSPTKLSRGDPSKKYHTPAQINSHTTTATNSLSATASALEHAASYERRLLRPGQRDIVSPLQVKRRMKPKIELPTKSRPRTDRRAPTDGTKFSFSGTVLSKPLPKISTELYKNANIRRNAVGLPTALAVNSKFIAVGTQRGIVLVFDLFEELRQQLGKSTAENSIQIGQTTGGSVTSLDLSSHGETVIAGYTSGYVVLWDVMKGNILKSITDVHLSTITSVRFVNHENLSVVSVDAGGLVNRLTFSKSMFLSSYSYESECLLDGTAGQILAMDVLPPFAENPKQEAGYHPSIKKLVLIALSSERSSFAIAVEPNVNVLHRWAKPVSENDPTPHHTDGSLDTIFQQTYLPCLAWGWSLISGGGQYPVPILARAWGPSIQLLHASFPPSDNLPDSQMLWPAFGIHEEFNASAPVVALEWLGKRSLVYLTITNEFTVVDSVMMTMLERLDFSGIKLVYAEFSLSRATREDPKLNWNCSTFQNSMRSSDDRLLILCQEELTSVSCLGARERISYLEDDGEWLEALALALDHYESTVKSLQDRKRDPDSAKDWSRHPEFSFPATRVSEDETWIADLLLRYLKLAVENAPSGSNHNAPQNSRSTTRIDLSQSHYQMLAGVCIEYCILTDRLDLLFGTIFLSFRTQAQQTVFLDVLEPYILNDKLHYIAPEVMAQFVDHCRSTNDISTVERCLLHMDVRIMDFDSILTLLRKNEMYSALCFVFSHGLDDFITPLEIMLEGVMDAADRYDLHAPRRIDGLPQNSFEKYGYKALLFVRHCFQSKRFPQGDALVDEDRIDTLRPQILRFLMQSKYDPSEGGGAGKSATGGSRAVSYPYLHILIMVDAKATLDVLSLALDAQDAAFAAPNVTIMESFGGWGVEVDGDGDGEPSRKGPQVRTPIDDSLCPDRQLLVGILSSIILPLDNTSAGLSSVETTWQDQVAKEAFLDFMAKYLLRGVVSAPKPLTFLVLSRMSGRATSAKLPSARRVAEERIIALLSALPTYSYDRNEVLAVVETAGMSRAALLLHKTAVTSLLQNGGIGIRERFSEHFVQAIGRYLDDDEKDFRFQVFQYIKKECMEAGMANIQERDGDPHLNKHDLLRFALCKKLPDLVSLDAVHSARLVAEVYVEDLDEILSSLATVDKGQILFQFLHAIVSGELTKEDSVAGPVLSSHLSVEHHRNYLNLMARFHPELVYQHLSAHDNYRPEECLKLCQEYEIADASAYLLERMGNVSSALQLMLQTLEGRMMNLKRVVRGTGSDRENKPRGRSRRKLVKETNAADTGKKKREIEAVKQILSVVLDLCERNSGPSAKNEHGSQLWFNVLDRLINAKGFLRLAKELPEHALVVSKALSELLRLTMQRMVSNVPLHDLVRKITTDHAENRLGEFREIIVSMLKTYSFELDVCRAAADVMHHDVRNMGLEKRRLKLRGLFVRSVRGIPLGEEKFSNGPKILDNIPSNSIFNCSSSHGDADVIGTQVQDNVKENEQGDIESALYRLRKKRALDAKQQHQQQRQQQRSGWHIDSTARVGMNMMTLSDQRFCKGESSDLAYGGRRYIGELSNAEHYGRFG